MVVEIVLGVARVLNKVGSPTRLLSDRRRTSTTNLVSKIATTMSSCCRSLRRARALITAKAARLLSLRAGPAAVSLLPNRRAAL